MSAPVHRVNKTVPYAKMASPLMRALVFKAGWVQTAPQNINHVKLKTTTVTGSTVRVYTMGQEGTPVVALQATRWPMARVISACRETAAITQLFMYASLVWTWQPIAHNSKHWDIAATRRSRNIAVVHVDCVQQQAADIVLTSTNVRAHRARTAACAASRG